MYAQTGCNTQRVDMTLPDSPTLFAPLAPWFEAEKRELPWRAHDLDAPHPSPWAVLVSELMLQQTQVITVIPYFTRWMARFPDPESLAIADLDEVHKLWEGLGYYRRARHLHACAERIRDTGWPVDLEGLTAMPGLGPYTAAAVASIAFQWATPALDGNAFRVLARLLALEEDPRKHARSLRDWLSAALTAHGPSRITQGIMELGATICTPAPRCGDCPLRHGCLALQKGLTASIPAPATRTPVQTAEIVLVALEAEGKWLLHRPKGKGLLAGLWQWPSLLREHMEQDLGDGAMQSRAAESAVSYGTLEMQTWPDWNQVYTHRKERVSPRAIHLPGLFPISPSSAWISQDDLNQLPMGRRDQRLRELLLTVPGHPANDTAMARQIARMLAARV